MNLLKALATVSGMTMISRILGFVRDVLIARIFGAGVATDAFLSPFAFPTCCADYLLRARFHRHSCQYSQNTKTAAHPEETVS